MIRPALAVIALSLTLAGITAPSHTQSPETTFASVIAKKCTPCHQGKVPSGGIDLSIFKNPAASKGAKQLLSRVEHAVSSHQMPPESAVALTTAERTIVLDSLRKIIDPSNCEVTNPGRVTLRRLNRREYDNTLRDLLSIKESLTEDFPNDDVGFGFDNIGDVLTLSPLLMEKYFEAAERAVRLAIVVPDAPSTRYGLGQLRPSAPVSEVGNDMCMFTANEATVDHVAKNEGPYRIKVEAYATPGGNEPANLRVTVDKGTPTNFAVNVGAATPGSYEVPLNLKKGRHTIRVAFTNDFYDPQFPDPAKRDRNLFIRYVEVWSPPVDPAALPKFQREMIPANTLPAKRVQMLKRNIANFASKAFRRPATVAEVDRAMAAFDMAMQDSEPIEKGAQLAVQSILVSPHFLFRIEPNGPDKKPRNLSNYELASRLSFFIWSSTPDDRLLSLAASGTLSKPAVLATELDRMLADPKATELTNNFAAQWLQLRKLVTLTRDPAQFPEFDPALLQDMTTETKLFFQSVLESDRPITDLLFAKHTFVNGRLAKLYGIPNISGDSFQKVDLSGTERSGLLGQASILTVTSNPTRTSPVKRGKWVLEEVFGTPPPPPPPGADNLVENQSVKGKSIRERLESHRKDPACANCHKQMDELGFALENFDAIGRFRRTDNGLPIDSRGELPGKVIFEGLQGLQRVVQSRQDRFVRTFVERLMTFALGRGMTEDDRCAIDTILKDTKSDGHKVKSVIKSIAMSAPFLMRQGEL